MRCVLTLTECMNRRRKQRHYVRASLLNLVWSTCELLSRPSQETSKAPIFTWPAVSLLCIFEPFLLVPDTRESTSWNRVATPDAFTSVRPNSCSTRHVVSTETGPSTSCTSPALPVATGPVSCSLVMQVPFQPNRSMQKSCFALSEFSMLTITD